MTRVSVNPMTTSPAMFELFLMAFTTLAMERSAKEDPSLFPSLSREQDTIQRRKKDHPWASIVMGWLGEMIILRCSQGQR